MCYKLIYFWNKALDGVIHILSIRVFFNQNSFLTDRQIANIVVLFVIIKGLLLFSTSHTEGEFPIHELINAATCLLVYYSNKYWLMDQSLSQVTSQYQNKYSLLQCFTLDNFLFSAGSSTKTCWNGFYLVNCKKNTLSRSRNLRSRNHHNYVFD